jgi:hypothetical protein
MVEYGLLASKSSDFFFELLEQLKGIWASIPFWIPMAVALGFVLLIYLILRSR